MGITFDHSLITRGIRHYLIIFRSTFYINTVLDSNFTLVWTVIKRINVAVFFISLQPKRKPLFSTCYFIFARDFSSWKSEIKIP